MIAALSPMYPTEFLASKANAGVAGLSGWYTNQFIHFLLPTSELKEMGSYSGMSLWSLVVEGEWMDVIVKEDRREEVTVDSLSTMASILSPPKSK